MFDFWEGFVEVMKQRFPGLVLRRLPEADRVVGQCLPSNEQEISVVNLYAAVVSQDGTKSVTGLSTRCIATAV